ncbi:MAG: hypothetical protein KDA92_15450, partial [Planctomycetales bacterium]|nr:hypothetical protein [Planctomycetales bacterium]
FLDREVPGGEEGKTKTFRELTGAYCLTTDPDQSVSRDYMEAAGENGIPCAFLVGKDGHIEWIGHPMSMDEPLKALVAGSWDRVAFAKELQERKAAELALRDVFGSLQRQDFDGALVKLDAALEKSPETMQLRLLKLQVLIAAGKEPESEEWAAKLFDSLKDQPESVNMVGWGVYQMATGGAVQKGALVDTAIRATAEAAKKADKKLKASVLDTLARLQFVNEDYDGSLATQQQAIKFASPEEREVFEEFVKEVEKAKAAKAAE